MATSASAAPESPSCRAATRKPNDSSCWLPAWRCIASIRASVSPEPPVPTAGGAGTLWTPGWLRATPAQYLDADPDSPESFLGYTLAGFAAWVSDQELVSIRRRTKAGLEKAKADG